MIHIDLFSGIGLFSYAADHVWNLEHIFCEIEDWPYKFLKQKYPNARIERNIKNFDGTEYSGRTFLLTAGVPCQPASVAGKRKGTEDDRWLWPEALRVMAEAKPEWALFENPLGILTLEKGLVFENLLLEMESQGYEVQPYIIPACAIGAVHRRDRIWIVAKSKQPRTWSQEREIDNKGRGTGEGGREGLRQGNGTIGSGGIASTNSNVANSEQSHYRSKIISKEIEQSQTERPASGISGSDSNAGNPDIGGRDERAKQEMVGQEQSPKSTRGNLNASDSRSKESRRLSNSGRQAISEIGESSRNATNSNRFNGNNAGYGSGKIRGELREKAEIQRGDYWQKPWPEVATELCRMDVSSTDRIHRLKALGNTIQWEVAVAIMQAIKQIYGT